MQKYYIILFKNTAVLVFIPVYNVSLNIRFNSGSINDDLVKAAGFRWR